VGIGAIARVLCEAPHGYRAAGAVRHGLSELLGGQVDICQRKGGRHHHGKGHKHQRQSSEYFYNNLAVHIFYPSFP
jgi:hypothetical protein